MDKIKFYGTRGSGSLTSRKYMEFGGATTCILLNLDNKYIMVDCGSGVTNSLEDLKDVPEIHVFISHSHMDHIAGIVSLFSAFKDKKIHIWGKTFGGVCIKESVNRLMNQSLWPVRADTYKNVKFHEIAGDVILGNITIKNMDSNHPGGCSLFRFECGQDVIVTAFDFCHLNGFEEKLIDFSKGATCLIYDGCFTQDEFRVKQYWGHSTPEEGAKIGKVIQCPDVVITHFGQYDDVTLEKWEKDLQQQYEFLRFARVGNKDEYQKIVDIGTLLTSEKDKDSLLIKILESCMEITNADGGTIYLLEGNNLDFKVIINKSKNTKFVKKQSPLSLPSVSIDGKNACATAAREKKLINISNCYTDTRYDFSGAREYDRLNDYYTKSSLVIPLIDEYDDVVGVLQLINSQNKDGEIVSFKKEDENILLSIASQVSMAIVNSDYSQKINELLYGFVKVMSVGIDERTPYNANHTRNMVKFAERFLDYEKLNDGPYKVDEKKKREILMSIWLHDIGKILTPIDIMNKDSRLGNLYQELKNRFDRRYLLLKLSLANGEISKQDYESLESERVSQIELVDTINKIGFLNDELKGKLDDLAKKTYIEIDGKQYAVITDEEYKNLSIIKGTLTNEERKIMQDHVVMTQKLLSQLNFPKYYDNIPLYAGSHHEFLNGTGYPNHMTTNDLPWPCRLITICDIFEALIAKDRPYKKPMSIEKAFSILKEMAIGGQLDESLVDTFEQSKVWEETDDIK